MSTTSFFFTLFTLWCWLSISSWWCRSSCLIYLFLHERTVMLLNTHALKNKNLLMERKGIEYTGYPKSGNKIKHMKNFTHNCFLFFYFRCSNKSRNIFRYPFFISQKQWYFDFVLYVNTYIRNKMPPISKCLAHSLISPFDCQSPTEKI